MRLCFGHLHSRFWPILASFVDYYSLFWGPGVISTINEHRVRLCVGHQHWQFWPILAHFMDYYSLFWGPGVISTINEHRVRLRVVINTRILANSGPFHGLLLTILGSRSDFHGCQTPGCQYSQFWLIPAHFMDYYSPFWGPIAISIVVEPQGALMCRSSIIALLADSGPFHGLLLTILGSRSDFHD